jgi:UDP-N-acetylglucosamine transferase subunit ALG13
MPGKEKPLLLVSPLDWGLGHTMRMIPVIRELLNLACEVVVACNSMQKIVLEKEFSGLRFVYLDGYNVRYGRNRTATIIKLLLSLPNILIKVKNEQMWFLRFLEQNKVTAVISDNRYGLWAPGISCIFVTHQLHIRSGLGKIADRIVQKILYKRIKAFTGCWVPDEKSGNLNIAGTLSHPAKLPAIPVQYIGCLSRFEHCTPELPGSGILIILSGPEPQRSILESRILAQLKSGIYRDIILIRGLPQSNTLPADIPGIVILNHAGTKKLNRFMCAAELIISRAGYTSIMDGLKMQKKMVVIPTPGQSEQEYLASHLSSEKIVVSISQKNFSIDEAIRRSASFSYRLPLMNMEQYKAVISNFIASLPS